MAVLGAELRRRGHDVTACVTSDLVDFMAGMGLTAVGAGFSAKEFLGSGEGTRLAAGGDARSFMKLLLDLFAEHADNLHSAMIKAAEDADVIVAGLLTLGEAMCLAESRGVPLVALDLAPTSKNSAFPPILAAQRKYPGAVNRVMHTRAERARWQVTSQSINDFRAQLHLPAAAEPVDVRLQRAAALRIQAYSRHLVPELDHWGPLRPLVGFLAMSHDQHSLLGEGAVDSDTGKWLADGEPPAFVGFGSMPVPSPSALLKMIDGFSLAAGMRVLVGAGWSAVHNDVGVDPSRVRIVGGIDHGAVLPRCRIAVHHGGAGTTAAVVRAGLPAVVCSFSVDQPFWGRRLERLGIGQSMPFTGLSEASLLRAAESMLGEEPRQRAGRVAALIREENAVGTAADLIEATAERQKRQ